MTIHSEHVIRQLRPVGSINGSLRHRMSTRTSQQRYAIPTGGVFHYVTNAQYLGELTAWLGFALLTWSLPGLAVLLISCFNLVPRALTRSTPNARPRPALPRFVIHLVHVSAGSFHNHAWYERTFGDKYKKLRRARLIPGIL